MTKIILHLVLIISAVPAFACPELSGSFDCASTTAPNNTFTFSKSAEGGEVVYRINGTKLVANGIPDSRSKGDGFPTIYTATCEGQSLRTRVQTQVSSSICPSIPLAIDSITVFTPQGQNIAMDDVTILSCPDTAPTNIRHKYICTKK